MFKFGALLRPASLLWYTHSVQQGTRTALVPGCAWAGAASSIKDNKHENLFYISQLCFNSLRFPGERYKQGALGRQVFLVTCAPFPRASQLPDRVLVAPRNRSPPAPPRRLQQGAVTGTPAPSGRILWADTKISNSFETD